MAIPSIPLSEEYGPVQVLAELAGLTVGLTAISYLFTSVTRVHVNKLFQGGILFVSYLFYLKLRITPPMPFSALATYVVGLLVGIFMWISSSEEYWQDARKPILAMMDGETATARVCRAVLLLALPCIAWVLAWNSMIVTVEEPIELRTVIPAPKPTFMAFGKEYVTMKARNPFRVNEQGQYDQHYTDALSAEETGAGLIRPGINPWTPEVSGYLRYVQEGGGLYFQNCFFCHGANLDARGPQNYASHPIATNFKQIRTVFYVNDGHSFLRTAGGGPGLPPEGFPWSSVMPPMEEHLTADEIWKVLLFKSWFTGGDPQWIRNEREQQAQ